MPSADGTSQAVQSRKRVGRGWEEDIESYNFKRRDGGKGENAGKTTGPTHLSVSGAHEAPTSSENLPPIAYAATQYFANG